MFEIWNKGKMQFSANNNNSIQFFIINVPSLQQNANYRNSTVNICLYISVLQHNIRLEHVMYRARK
jgi:hypothetical protein